MSFDNDYKKQMYSTYNTFSTKLSAIRVDILSPSILFPVAIIKNQKKLNIRHIASLSNYDNSTIMIEVWDKSNVPEIQKAIQRKFLDFSIRSNENVIFVSRPPLTEEYRNKLISDINAMSEETKVSLRNIRKKFIKKNEAENNSGSIKKRIQESLKDYEKKIEDMVKKKSDSIRQT